MIIKEIRFSNFLVFSGEQSIQLPTSAESNVVVILAPNNTGKTNVIRALKFLFYGHLAGCTEATAYRLIHDGARAAARVGNEVSASVQVSIELNGEELTLRRTVKALKCGPDQWLLPEVSFGRFEDIRGSRPRLLLDSDGFYQTKLRTMVPEKLFDAFYFKGEPLDGKLLGGVNAIRESLGSFLHEDRWEEAESAAERVRQHFQRQLGRLTEQNADYTRLLNDEELFRNHLVKEQDKLRQLKTKREELVAKFEEVTSRLQELGTGGDAEKWVSRLRELRGRLDTARRTHQKSDSEIARLVGTSRGIPFLIEALPTARRILHQMQEDNILPADISEPFVNRVLSAKCCVCGHPHDDHTRAAWKSYKEKTLSVDLNRGLSDLLNAVDEKSNRGFVHFTKELAAKISSTRDARSAALTEIETIEKSVADLEKKLQDSPVEEIRRLSNCLRELTVQRERMTGEITQLETGISNIQNTLKSHKDKLHKARPLGALAQKEKTLRLARERAEKLRLLIQESREVMTRSFYEILQRSVTEYYDHSAYDGSRARINRATLLPAIEADGQIRGNLGGGQSQLLALAYIVSLSRLRKNLHLQMKKLGIGYGQVDDQSFVLDSPFNQVTEHYAHAIAKFLDGNARQAILLLARHQWNLVRPVIEPASPKVFAFRYHTLEAKITELQKRDPKLEDFTYQVYGKKLNLIEELPKSAEHPFTKIIPLN